MVWPENICRPQELSLTCEISKNKTYSLSKFPQFSLIPDPNNLHEKSEWGKFLNYLCKYEKVWCSIFFLPKSFYSICTCFYLCSSRYMFVMDLCNCIGCSLASILRICFAQSIFFFTFFSFNVGQTVFDISS